MRTRATITMAVFWFLRSFALGAYASPDDIAISGDGKTLYVTCSGSDEVLAVDVLSGRIIHTGHVGRVPRGITLSADGKRIYATNSWSDTVTELDALSLRSIRELPTGFEPTGVAVDDVRGTLYVANRISGTVSLLDLTNPTRSIDLSSAPGASYVTSTADRSRVYVTHVYPLRSRRRGPPESEINIIDTRNGKLRIRLPIPGAAGLFHVAVSHDGGLGMVAELRPKNLIPLVQVEHGSVFTDSVAVFGDEVGGVIQLPLDKIERYFSLPFGVAIAADKQRAYISASGSDEIAILNLSAIIAAARSSATASRVNDLSASRAYVISRIAVGRNPRGIVVAPDGKTLYVANRLDDTISVVDTRRGIVTRTIPIGATREITSVRRGERAFYSAMYTFGHQFACANCHIDSTFDGLAWDLGHGNFGVEVVDTRSLEHIGETAPFKWNGTTPDLTTECGPITERFIFRSQGPRGADLEDLVEYVSSIPLRPNRYRRRNGRFSAAQLRGKTIFERTVMKDGTRILPILQCPSCHSGPDYTNQKLAFVGTSTAGPIDTPQLTNVAYSAPYLHDGRALTLEDIFSKFNPNNLHGVTSDLSAEELDDLAEYLRTL